MDNGRFDPHFYDPRAERAKRPAAKPPAQIWVWLLALLGGVGGTLAAFYENSTQGVWVILLIVLLAPAIEEVCKPIAVILMIEKRPRWIRSRRQVVAMSMLGAVVFSALENLFYVFIKAPRTNFATYQAWMNFVVFRFTVCSGMHVLATAVFSVGLAKAWRRVRTGGGNFEIETCFRYYVAAVAIHAFYNTAAVLLTLFGVVRF